MLSKYITALVWGLASAHKGDLLLPHAIKLSEGTTDPSGKTSNTSPLLAVFEQLRGAKLFATADFNLDRSSDLLFYNSTGKAVDVMAACKPGDDSTAWKRCGTSKLPIHGEPLFLRPFQMDKILGYIGVVRNSDKSQDNETSGTENRDGCSIVSFVPNYRDLSRSPYDYIEAWQDQSNCEFAPLIVDLNFDGKPDILTMVDEQRIGYIYSGAKGEFTRAAWDDLDPYFDLEHYSVRQSSVVSLVDDTKIVGIPAIATKAPESFSWSIWHWLRSWVAEESEEEMRVSLLRAHLDDFRSYGRTLYYQVNGKWLPRPLPLRNPSLISSRIAGHAEIDINGDCLADLIFVIDSPDFINRQELEIWITESDEQGGTKRRQWRNQRLLLPEGTLSIGFADGGHGGTDLVVLATDNGDNAIYSFKMLHEFDEENLPSSLCTGFSFSYNGLSGQIEREFMTISRVSGQVMVPILFLRDIDGDRYDDLLLVIKEGHDTVLRVFRSKEEVGGKGKQSDDPVTGGVHDIIDGHSQAYHYLEDWLSNLMDRLRRVLSPQAWLEALVAAWRGGKTAEMRVARLYEKFYDLKLSGTYEEGTSVFGWIDPSTFLAWNGNLHAREAMTIFPQTGYRGQPGYFTRVKVYEGTASEGRSALPLSGSVVVMAPPDINGRRIPVRRTISTVDSHYLVRPSSLSIGFGDSSNYIDVVKIGLPFVKGIESLEDLQKTWKAIMPNSELLIEIPSHARHNKDLWKLTLIVSPGRQALRVVIAMVVALVCVGLYNISLARRRPKLFHL